LISIEKADVATPELNSRPHLVRGCRLHERSQEPRVLHMPERALRLNGPSLEIIQRCDGKHTVQEIVSELQLVYSKADPQLVEKDVLGYLALLHSEQALEFTSDEADWDEGAR
jgi:pyrroloquinoline quinone biosynthesis protein D